MRKVFSFVIKISVVVAVVTALAIFSVSDSDYKTSWSVALMYFTGQSNLWISLIFITLIVFFILRWVGKIKEIPKFLYVIKFAFTVCIGMTGVVFCGLIAPFAGSLYDSWSAYSVLTHLVVPILSVVDFFVDDYPFVLRRKDALYAFLPPIIYFSIASVLCVLKVDFGRGDPFPYFFMNFYSKAGMFGFIWGSPPQIGSAYWFMLLTIVFSIITLILFSLKRKGKANIKPY